MVFLEKKVNWIKSRVKFLGKQKVSNVSFSYRATDQDTDQKKVPRQAKVVQIINDGLGTLPSPESILREESKQPRLVWLTVRWLVSFPD